MNRILALGMATVLLWTSCVPPKSAEEKVQPPVAPTAELPLLGTIRVTGVPPAFEGAKVEAVVIVETGPNTFAPEAEGAGVLQGDPTDFALRARPNLPMGEDPLADGRDLNAYLFVYSKTEPSKIVRGSDMSHSFALKADASRVLTVDFADIPER